MDRNFPYVLLVNVEIAELQGLRDKAGEAIRYVGREPSDDLQVVYENEAIFFCFKNSTAAVLFELHCFRNQIPRRRIGDPDWLRPR